MEKIRSFKYFNIVAILYVTILLATVPIAYRITGIGPIIISSAAFYVPIMFSLGDIIAEVYGYQLARQIFWCAILADLVFALLETLAIHFPMASFQHQQGAYQLVLGRSLHGVLGGITALLIASFINIFILAKWKVRLKGKRFWLRSLGSTAIGEAVLYIIANLIAFIGVFSVSKILEITLYMYGVQIVLSFILVWPAAMVVSYLKKSEQLDVYDYNTDFNPFRFQLED